MSTKMDVEGKGKAVKVGNILQLRGGSFTLLDIIQLTPALTDFKGPTIFIGFRRISVISNMDDYTVPLMTKFCLRKSKQYRQNPKKHHSILAHYCIMNILFIMKKGLIVLKGSLIET